jgi:WD40 repeat protein
VCRCAVPRKAFDETAVLFAQAVVHLLLRHSATSASASVSCLAVSHALGCITSGFTDGTALMWRFTPPPPQTARLAAMSSSGAECELRPRGYSLRDKKLVKGHAGCVVSLWFSDVGGLLVTASVDGRVKVWSASGNHLGRRVCVCVCGGVCRRVW